MAFPRGEKSLNVCGPRVRQIRTEKGWSRAKLAEQCQIAGWDISEDTIDRIEAKARWVGDIELVTLAKVLEVSLDTLVSRPGKGRA